MMYEKPLTESNGIPPTVEDAVQAVKVAKRLALELSFCTDGLMKFEVEQYSLTTF